MSQADQATQSSKAEDVPGPRPADRARTAGPKANGSADVAIAPGNSLAHRVRSLRTNLGMAWNLFSSGDNFRPAKVTAILTERCHLKCEFCNLWKDPDSGVSTERWLEFFRRNPFIRWANLSGGELFAKEKLDMLLAGIVDALPKLALLDFPTAGTIPEKIEKTVRKLLATRLNRLAVTVSIDGGPEIHDRIRGVEGTFDRAVETYRRLRTLRSRRFSVHVGCTLTQEAAEQVRTLREAIGARIPNFDDNELHFNLAHTSGHYYRNEDFEALPGQSALEILESAHRRPGAFSWVEWVYGSLAHRGLEENFPPVGCETVRHTVFIAPDLTVFPCSIWDHPIGNLKDTDLSLSDLLRQDEARKTRAMVDAKNCPGCFTPCEAIPAILAHPLRSTVRALVDGRREPRRA